jgi:hypothetical protein
MGVMAFLIIMLVGSLASTFLIPPFLAKIDRTGQVNFFGVRFPF